MQEDLDDLNQDTFGGDLPVARDFDFGSKNVVGAPAAPAPAMAPKKDAFNLDSDSLLGPRQSAAPSSKTLAEIEAEMMRQAVPTQLQQPQKPAYRTLEEIEAEIMQRPAQQTPMLQRPQATQQGLSVPQAQPQQSAMPIQQASTQPPPMQPSVDLNALLTQQVQLQQQQQLANNHIQSLLTRPNNQRMHQSDLTLNQLHQLRGQLLSRQQTPDIIAEVRRIEHVISSIEQEENLRRRRMQKIADMSHYNNVMWNSEKDFITRIQLSQLLNTAGPDGGHDPLKDDFYFTVFQHLRGAKAAALQNAQQAVQQGGNRGGKRKLLAVQKMAIQVQRIVEDARKKPRATQCMLIPTSVPL